MRITKNKLEKIQQLKNENYSLDEIGSNPEIYLSRSAVQYWIKKMEQPKLKKSCKFCGKIFEVWGTNRKRKYCSDKCLDKYWDRYRALKKSNSTALKK